MLQWQLGLDVSLLSDAVIKYIMGPHCLAITVLVAKTKMCRLLCRKWWKAQVMSSGGLGGGATGSDTSPEILEVDGTTGHEHKKDGACRAWCKHSKGTYHSDLEPSLMASSLTDVHQCSKIQEGEIPYPCPFKELSFHGPYFHLSAA